jgi:hypothetical protein
MSNDPHVPPPDPEPKDPPPPSLPEPEEPEPDVVNPGMTPQDAWAVSSAARRSAKRPV